MSARGNLWAVAFDDAGRAAQVHDELVKLDYENRSLVLRDVAVAVRYDDGTLTLNGDPFPDVTKVRTSPVARFLAAMALGAPPLSGAGVGSMFAIVGSTPADVGISDDFIRDVARLIEPGTSALFVLDEVGDMDAVLKGIRGLGGRVLRTSVDVQHAKRVQSALAASLDCPGDASRPDASSA
jgi:uncharacterized membrane protein